MEPNGYTDEVANALFATLGSEKMGLALEGIAAIGYAMVNINDTLSRIEESLSHIAYLGLPIDRDEDGTSIVIDSANYSSFSDAAGAAQDRVKSLDSIAVAIKENADAKHMARDEIEETNNVLAPLDKLDRLLREVYD